MTIPHRRSRLLAFATVVALSAGCSTLPTSGDVKTRPASVQEAGTVGFGFAPPGPAPGDSPSDIVRGFLLAMQANPPTTSVARSFLTSGAKGTWNPSEGTIVYDAATVEISADDSAGGQVVATLPESHRVSGQGAWLDGTDPSTTTLTMSVVHEDGQWRIDDPPNVLAVPATYFSNQFLPFNLYYFDHTGTVLVPARIYVPWGEGEDTATNLVRALLAGPPPSVRDVADALPSGLELDELAVVVDGAGVATVPMGEVVLGLSPAALNRFVVQLGWTLRQVPGVNRLRLTSDGAPMPLTDGGSVVSVGVGAEYSPVASVSTDLVAISDGRVLRDDGTAIAGPFGEGGFALRSLAWNARDHLLAGVSANGRRVFVAPDRGLRTPSRVGTFFDGGTDVLRPTYDRFGALWLVDNTGSGAVVHVIRGGRDRTLRVPGVTGSRISAFTVTKDGSAFVAVLASGKSPTVLVSRLPRAPGNRVLRALPARILRLSDPALASARDVVQYDATSVAVLTRSESDIDRIHYVELDGSTGPPASAAAAGWGTLPATASSLAADPDPALPLRFVSTDGRLYAFQDPGRWVRSSLTGVLAVAYAR